MIIIRNPTEVLANYTPLVYQELYQANSTLAWRIPIFGYQLFFNIEHGVELVNMFMKRNIEGRN